MKFTSNYFTSSTLNCISAIMFNYIFFVFLFLFLVQPYFSNAQEKADSLEISPFLNFNSSYFVDDAFHFQHSLNVFNNLKITMDQIYFQSNDEVARYVFDEYHRNFFYGYSKGGYTFWQFGNPLNLGMHFSFQEALGWNKFDLFFDADGVLVNKYIWNEDTGELLYYGDKNPVWRASVGISYELKPDADLRLRTRSVFSGKKYLGQGYEGGVRMKF